MQPRRRMGSQDSPTAQVLLDATERVLRRNGYCAVTSQKVAQEAGVKRQLVFYYFENVEEMLLAAFERRVKIISDLLAESAGSARPIHALWDVVSHAFDARLIFEYSALANHNENVRKKILDFVKTTRELEISTIKKVYKAKKFDKQIISPEAVAFLMSAISMSLVREEGTGMTVGHREIRDLVNHFLQSFE